jgi:hypothetical protein
MSKKEISDFIVLDKIADECGDDGIAMFPNILKGSFTSKGGQITFGVPEKVMQWTLRGTHYFVMYAIKIEDFERIKSELENAPI